MRVKGVLGGLALMLGLTMPVAAAPPDIAATAHPQAGRSMAGTSGPPTITSAKRWTSTFG